MPLTSHGGDVVSRAPGKLYIAGEYAVVEPGHRAVLVSVDRFITVRITPCSPAGGHAGTISSRLYATGSRPWRRRPQDGQAEAVGGEDDYIISAIRVVEALVTQGGGRPGSFDLSVSSELEEDDGRKLGLGSSSAGGGGGAPPPPPPFYGLAADDLTVYKLAMLASDTVQPIGSGGDIAASAMTGWVAYTSPDRSWLRRARQRAGAGGMSDLVEADWPGLSVRRLPSPSLRLQVGWTGAPASTPALVADVQTRSHGADDYAVFLRDSQDCLARLITAIEDDDAARIMRQIARNRALLAGLSRIGGRTIETTELVRLVEIALDHGATAKSSGAGGGDCGIALCPPATDLFALRAAWETAGIRPLDLSVYSQDSSAACAADAAEARADSSTASPVKVTP
jgi:phosphomevalonate kinase